MTTKRLPRSAFEEQTGIPLSDRTKATEPLTQWKERALKAEAALATMAQRWEEVSDRAVKAEAALAAQAQEFAELRAEYWRVIGFDKT